MSPRRRSGPAGQGGQRGRGSLLALMVTLVSSALVVAGVVLIVEGPPAERIPVDDQLASPPSVVSPSRAGSTRRDAGPVTSWPAYAAGPRTVRASSVAEPTTLSVPSLVLHLSVRPTGVDGSGMMWLPPHPGDLGWYRYGASPDDGRGSVVLAGHVDSRVYGTGPLIDLSRLHRGARLQVTTDDGHQHVYVTTAVQRIAKSRLDLDELFTRSGPPVLRVVTCAGPYLPSKGGYQDNLVITAAPA